jgi:hypothetical protein
VQIQISYKHGDQEYEDYTYTTRYISEDDETVKVHMMRIYDVLSYYIKYILII